MKKKRERKGESEREKVREGELESKREGERERDFPSSGIDIVFVCVHGSLTEGQGSVQMTS